MMIIHALGNDIVKMGSYIIQILTRKDIEYFEYMCNMHNSWQLSFLKWLKIIENVFPNFIAFNIILIFFIFGSKPIDVI